MFSLLPMLALPLKILKCFVPVAVWSYKTHAHTHTHTRTDLFAVFQPKPLKVAHFLLIMSACILCVNTFVSVNV